jgi:hypothetical protein
MSMLRGDLSGEKEKASLLRYSYQANRKFFIKYFHRRSVRQERLFALGGGRSAHFLAQIYLL